MIIIMVNGLFGSIDDIDSEEIAEPHRGAPRQKILLSNYSVPLIVQFGMVNKSLAVDIQIFNKFVPEIFRILLKAW
jgi:hypothetical protein